MPRRILILGLTTLVSLPACGGSDFGVSNVDPGPTSTVSSSGSSTGGIGAIGTTGTASSSGSSVSTSGDTGQGSSSQSNGSTTGVASNGSSDTTGTTGSGTTGPTSTAGGTTTTGVALGDGGTNDAQGDARVWTCLHPLGCAQTIAAPDACGGDVCVENSTAKLYRLPYAGANGSCYYAWAPGDKWCQ